MTLWIDAQLSPALAAWINREYAEIEAQSVRAVGLRDATDREIFEAAREAGAVVMSKDSDFLNLLDEHGPPPQVIWVTCGNTSNRRMREILRKVLPRVVEALENGEPLVEISGE
jgi:predicted nuclease of predicted toxin-antitoxin system